MVAQVIIAIPRHNNYHHPRAVAEGTSHCRTPACEGRPPVLGMVARCKVLTQSSLTTLSLPLHVAQHHSRGTARDEVLILPSHPLSRPHARSSGFPRPPVSPGVCLSHILKKMYLVLTESPRQGISVGPFCCSTSRSKSRPVCLTNVRHWRPMRGSQVLLASFSLAHARSSGFPRPQKWLDKLFVVPSPLPPPLACCRRMDVTLPHASV